MWGATVFDLSDSPGVFGVPGFAADTPVSSRDDNRNGSLYAGQAG
jgi:hypothetical protein